MIRGWDCQKAYDLLGDGDDRSEFAGYPLAWAMMDGTTSGGGDGLITQ